MDLISRQAATTIPVMPKEHREYQTYNLDDAYEQGWNDLQECIENLPPVQLEIPNNQTHLCAGCNYVYPECPASEADVVFGNGEGGDNICMCACFKPKEPKHGEWEYHSNPTIGINPEDAYCSCCGFHVDTTDDIDFDEYNFCPRCGAKMER